MSNSLIKRALLWGMVVLYMAGIFVLSHQDGITSNRMTQKVTKKVQQHVALPSAGKRAKAAKQPDYNLLLRKVGHFSGFLGLCVLISLAFLASGAGLRTAVCLSLLICILYASSDELHQQFVEGRTARYQDVLLDTAGALAGAAAVVVWRKRRGKKASPDA